MKTFLSILPLALLASLGFAQDKTLVGEWIGHEEDGGGDTVTLEFKEGGTGTLGLDGEKMPMQWKEDWSKTPHHLDLTVKMPGDDEARTMLTIFEVIDAETVKIAEPREERPTDFESGDNLIAKRLGEPFDGDPAKAIIGDWKMKRPDEGVALTFKEDGTGSLKEGSDNLPLKYSLDGSKTPNVLTVTIEGETKKSFVEFVTEDAVQITEPRDELPEDMGRAAFFERVKE